MVKKIFIVIFTITLMILCYQMVGNLIRAARGVILIGDNNAHFLGYYMIAGGYAVLFIINIVILCFIIFFKKGKNNRKYQK